VLQRMADTQANKKWEEVQKKAFTHWVNSQLGKRNESIDNLETGFVSGVHLIHLVEILTGKTIETKWTHNPKLKAHKITNCFIALQFLTEQCGVKNLTISAEDIVNGDRLTLILGFCWQLLRTFQEPATSKKGSSFEQNLLQWVKDTLGGYSDINLDAGFKSESFHTGKVFLGLLNEFDSSILKYSDYKASNKLENCEAALNLAEKHVKLPILIDPLELADGKTSEKNMVLYLSLFYNAFKERASGENRESLMKRIKELEEKIRVITAENDQLRGSKSSLETEQKDLHSKLTVVSSEKVSAKTARDDLQSQYSQLETTYSKNTADLKAQIKELEENIKLLQSSGSDSEKQLQNAKDDMARERDAVKEELKKTKERLLKEREELQKQHEELLANLKKAAKAREELEELMKTKQEHHGRSIHSLRKHLLQHVHDMHVWKVFLEQDREYESEDLHIIMEPELDGFSFSEQVSTLDTAVTEENEKLDRLHKEREKEIAEAKALEAKNRAAYDKQLAEENKKAEELKKKSATTTAAAPARPKEPARETSSTSTSTSTTSKSDKKSDKKDKKDKKKDDKKKK